jgi:hypothetical protein
VTTINPRRLVLAAALSLVASSAARADNTVCSGAITLTPDGAVQTGTMTGPTPLRWFLFVAKADRSYSITIENRSPIDVADRVDLASVASDCAATPLPAGTQFNGIGNSEPSTIDEATGVGGGRYGMLTVADSAVFIELAASGLGAVFAIRVEDTTQVNTFFSTFSGFNTFYRFTNTTNNALTVRLKVVSDAGVVVKDTTFVIPPNRSAPTRNTTVGDLNVPVNTAGFTLFMHNGPPNALAADGFLSGNGVVLPLKIVDARQKR